MGSEGGSWSSRGREGSRDYRGVDASEGFAPVRVVWICALWALVHSVLASKQVKDLIRRVAGSRYRDGLYRFIFNAQSVVSLLAAARQRSLPCEATLVLALPSEPGCLSGRVAFGRAGHGDIAFRRTNATAGPPYRKGASSRP